MRKLTIDERFHFVERYGINSSLRIDPYVNWKLHKSFEMFKKESYDGTIILLGATVEEEIARLYEIKNNYPDMKHKERGIVLKDVIDSGWLKIDAEDKELIESLQNARDYLAHSHRILKGNTRDRLKDGKLAAILPDYYTEPRIGNIEQQDTAINALEKVTKLINKTTGMHPVERVDGESVTGCDITVEGDEG